jgi:uncharacterized protein (DUF2147 family)
MIEHSEGVSTTRDTAIRQLDENSLEDAVSRGVIKDPAMQRFFIAATVVLSLTATANAASHLEGHWTNPQENVVVDIAPCRTSGGTALCGRAISGSSRAKAKSIRSGAGNLVGAALMTNLVPAGGEQWRGNILVPDRNVHAPARIQILSADRIKVSGCVWSFFCKSQVWTRVR